MKLRNNNQINTSESSNSLEGSLFFQNFTDTLSVMMMCCMCCCMY
ncbi:MAG: hypothetical protein OQK06_07320 [Flavobacteriales bacterium]|nr:hypothetical protein [Flavobacteriales bacterium]MCW8913121.1 hypothetical protein [Flavobacteriales bacterium]MCW8989299.1 hypothetical protein [Flavobacteriales bacterium]